MYLNVIFSYSTSLFPCKMYFIQKKDYKFGSCIFISYLIICNVKTQPKYGYPRITPNRLKTFYYMNWNGE